MRQPDVRALSVQPVCKREEPAHCPQNSLTSWTSCRWIVELMPELAVVVTLEYVLAVVLELLSLFDESTRASIPAC